MPHLSPQDWMFLIAMVGVPIAGLTLFSVHLPSHQSKPVHRMTALNMPVPIDYVARFEQLINNMGDDLFLIGLHIRH